MASGYIYMWFARFGDDIENQTMLTFQSVIEGYFCFSMITNFVTDFIPDKSHQPDKSILNIARRYIAGDFLIDLIPLLPFTLFVEINEDTRILFLLKVLRMVKAMNVLDV